MRINFISVNIAYELKSNWITVANRFTGMFCCDECITLTRDAESIPTGFSEF